MRRKRLFGLLIVAALTILAIPLALALPGVYGDGDDKQFTPPKKTELKYPNLGSMLNQLVARVESGEASAEEAAASAPLHQGASVAVTFYLSGNADSVVGFLEDHGGSPRNVGQDYIEAYVPVTLLGGDSLGTARGHSGAGNHPTAAGPDRPDYRARPCGAPFDGLEPGRVQRRGHQGGRNRCRLWRLQQTHED